MKKYKIGYTIGVFDLFHIGHLNILERCKNQCEYLIVGVCTDELVQSYKNKQPIIPYDERKRIVESIKYVDKVVPQDSRDKIIAMKKYNFDVLFVSEQYKDKFIYSQTECELKKNNIDVIYFPYTKGISSTKLTKVLDELLYI